MRFRKRTKLRNIFYKGNYYSQKQYNLFLKNSKIFKEGYLKSNLFYIPKNRQQLRNEFYSKIQILKAKTQKEFIEYKNNELNTAAFSEKDIELVKKNYFQSKFRDFINSFKTINERETIQRLLLNEGLEALLI